MIVENEDKKKACNKMLLAMLGNEELVDKWWDSNNLSFGMTPNEAWEYDYEGVIKYILGYYGS
jgi:hypothetical protein